MSLANLRSPFGTPGLPAGSLPTTTPPGSIGFDPSKVEQQMQVDPNVRTMMAQFFGDPASRHFVQDSGGVVAALARPDNPWTPGTPMVATPSEASPGASFSSASGPSAETAPNPQARAMAHFVGGSTPNGPSAEVTATPGASLASRPPGTQQPPGTPELYPTAHDYALAHPEDVSVPPRPVAPMDNVHGARKALFLAFLGLNKFGAGLDHQQNSYADEFLGRELNATQAQATYDASAPQLKHQAEELAYNNYLGQQEKSADITSKYSQMGMGQVQQAIESLHNGLIQRWQSNVDADAPSFLQNANEQLKGVPPQVRAQIWPLLNSITQLPRSAPNFKVTNGTVEPLLYRGQSYGLQPSANEPPEVTQARTAAMGSLQQGELAKLDPIIRGQLGEPPVNGQPTAAQRQMGITDMASYMKHAETIKEKMNTAGVRIQMGAFGNPEDPALTPIVDAVGKGNMDMNTALQRVTPAGRANFVNALYAKYPDYKESNYDVGKKTTEYFTSGEGGKNINAFNTASEHLDQLSTLSKGLQNGDVQLVNKTGNAWKAATGQAAPTSFNMVKNAVAGEIAKTFKGNATEGEISSINETINSAMSPEQLDGAISQAKALMQSKLHANLQQYLQGVQGKPAFEGAAGAASGNVVYARDPQGKLHQAPKGTAVPRGWTLENK
jgi:hypothetical protein